MTQPNSRRAPREALVFRSKAYIWLMAALFGLMFVVPVLDRLGWGILGHSLALMTTFAVAMYGIGRSRYERHLIIVLGLIAAALTALSLLPNPTGPVLFLHDLSCTAFYGCVALVMLRNILARGSDVTFGLISGAIAIYLLIGVIFANLYGMVALIDPSAFSGAVEGAAAASIRFYYFSMVTITTLGYGDVLPINEVARGLAALEAILGQIYLTVLVARLVGMNISASMPGKEPNAG
jgi:hypothetical protein